jgi:WD40 repeat protein
VLSCGDDGVRVWDTATQTERLHFSSEVLTIAVLPKSQVLVAGTRQLELWDYEADRMLGSFDGHEGDVRALAVSPDGKQVLSGTGFKRDGLGFKVPGECLIRLWDIDSRQELKRFNEHRGEILSLAFLPDGQRFVSISSDGTMRLWDLAKGEVLKTEGKAREPGTIVKDGRRIVTGTSPSEQIDISNDGRYLLRGQTLWDINEWKRAFRFGQFDSRPPLCAAFRPDGSRVVLGKSSGKITLWDLATKAEIGSATAFVNRSTVFSVAFSPDGSQIVSAGSGRRGGFDALAEGIPVSDLVVRVWSLENRAEPRAEGGVPNAKTPDIRANNQ